MANKNTKSSAVKTVLVTVAEWAKKVGLSPKAARRQLRSGSIAGATKAEGEWKVPADAKPAERKAKESKPAETKAAAPKTGKKISVKKFIKDNPVEE